MSHLWLFSYVVTYTISFLFRDTVKNVVRNADISRSFYFLSLKFILGKHKSDLGVNNFPCKHWKSHFSRCSIYKRSYWNFLQGNSKMLFVTLLFKSQKMHFLITLALLTVEYWHLVNQSKVTHGGFLWILCSEI